MYQVLFAILGAGAFCALYLVGRMARTVLAWGNRDPGPRERVVFYLAVFAIAGAVAGWLAYQPFAVAQQCRATGQPVIPCTFFPR